MQELVNERRGRASASVTSKQQASGLLSQDTFFIGSLKGIGKIYVHVAVDTFGSSRTPTCAIATRVTDPETRSANPSAKKLKRTH